MTAETTFERPENLTIPVDDTVELRLVGPDLGPELYALVKKNYDHLIPWVAWAANVNTEEDQLTSYLINLDAYHAGTAYPMAIFVDNRLSGMTDIRNIGSKMGVEVGYWLDEDQTGKGVATKAVQALIDFARERHQINRIVLNTYDNNDASSAVANRLGFTVKSKHQNFQDIMEKHFVKSYE